MVTPSRGRGVRRRPRSEAQPERPAEVAPAPFSATTTQTFQSDSDVSQHSPQAVASSRPAVPASLPVLPPPTHVASTEDTFQARQGEYFTPDFHIPHYESSVYQHTSCHDQLGDHIPNKLKVKIWEGQFVDLSLLLKSASDLNNFESQGDLQIRNGRLCIMQPKPNSFLPIEKWTSAFLVFTSIMLEKHVHKAHQLLKYIRDIRLAASRSATWYKYDEQYRLRKAAAPHTSWGEINAEYWLLYVSGGSTQTHLPTPVNITSTKPADATLPTGQSGN